MNIRAQSWLNEHQITWQKIESILAKIEKKGQSGLTRTELQELGGLYRSVAADLSRVRARLKDQAKTWPGAQQLQVYLNNLVVRAHNQIYQSNENVMRALFNFFWFVFPALARKYIFYILLAMLVVAVPLFMSYLYVGKDPNFINLEVSPRHPLVNDEVLYAIEKHKLWTEGKEKISPLASSFIITNNIRVIILAFAMGISFAIGTVLILFLNGLMVGTIFGACHLHGMARQLLAFISAHGFLELSAIFISGGAGLLMGKALLFPGQYKRVDSLKLISKDALGLFAGCIPLLLVAGMIEGFISMARDIPPSAKYAIGISSFIVLLLYLFHGFWLKKPTMNEDETTTASKSSESELKYTVKDY